MWKFKATEGEFCFVLDFSTGKCFEEDASPLCREIPSVREPRLGWVVGARRSLARLLDVLGSRAWMLVYGGMGLLVGHLGSRRGKVFITPGDGSRDEHRRFGWAGAFPLLVVLVLLFLGISRVRMFLHNSHPTSFHGGRVSCFRL